MKLNLTPADIYETYMVPAMFSEWADALTNELSLRSGLRVLDLACGTGIVARRVYGQVGATGRVVGLDLNPKMLDRARSLAPDVEWIEGNAGSLPFPDDEFDVVVCQQGLQFFPDPGVALGEVARVTVHGGVVATATWCELTSSPGHEALTASLLTRLGPNVAGMMEAVFGLGDEEKLRSLFADADFLPVKVERRTGRARFESGEAFARYVVAGSVLGRSGVEVSEETLNAICIDVAAALREFETPEGLEFPMQAYVVLARTTGEH